MSRTLEDIEARINTTHAQISTKKAEIARLKAASSALITQKHSRDLQVAQLNQRLEAKKKELAAVTSEREKSEIILKCLGELEEQIVKLAGSLDTTHDALIEDNL